MRGVTDVVVRCGSPDCPESPVIAESPSLPTELRTPCPSCGSRDRLVNVYAAAALTTTATLTATLEVTRPTAGTATTVAERTRTEPSTRVEFPEGLITYKAELRWVELTTDADPHVWLEVVDTETREVLAGSFADTPSVALDNVRDALLPPSSTARIVGDEGPPVLDDDA